MNTYTESRIKGNFFQFFHRSPWVMNFMKCNKIPRYIRRVLTWELMALRCIWATLRSNLFMEMSSWISFALLKSEASRDRCCIRKRVSKESWICLIWASKSMASFLRTSWDGRTWTADSLSITNSSFKGGGMLSWYDWKLFRDYFNEHVCRRDSKNWLR